MSHQDDFVLQRPVMKVRFVDVMKDSPNKDHVLKMISSDEFDEFHRTDSITVSSALRYFDNSDVWMDARDLAAEFGVDYPQRRPACGLCLRYQAQRRGAVGFLRRGDTGHSSECKKTRSRQRFGTGLA